jgi:DNA topoisomerase-3
MGLSAYAAFRKSLKKKPDDEESDAPTLPPVAEGSSFTEPKTSVAEHLIAPPKAFSEATLLSAMENAADTAPDAERKGLGTPATRAAIIEKIILSGFAERKGKQLIPTQDGMNLIAILPESLTSPLLTAEWENALTLIAQGKADPADFMRKIEAMARDLCKDFGNADDSKIVLFKPKKEVIGTCPRCGKSVNESAKNFHCEDRSCGFENLYEQENLREIARKFFAEPDK